MAEWERSTRLMDGLILVGAFVALGLAISSWWPTTSFYPRSHPTAREVEGWDTLPSVGHRIGSRSPAVTIVEFGDYQCPACRRVHRTLQQVLELGEPETALIYRHWPLPQHPLAYFAARAAVCASAQGQFEAFHRFLLETSDWQANPMAVFRLFGEKLRMGRLEEFEACLTDLDPEPTIERDVAAARALGLIGTPSLIVNGVLLGSYPDSAEFLGLIRSAAGSADRSR